MLLVVKEIERDLQVVLNEHSALLNVGGKVKSQEIKKIAGRGCGVLNLGTNNEFSNHHNGKEPDCMPFW